MIVCCIFETSAAASKRHIGELQSTRFIAHVLPSPDRLTFAVYRPPERTFPHREGRFHTGY
ncbi:unnamed protein product [Scytosiphon promiscuus]